jgi:hypothetical protein
LQLPLDKAALLYTIPCFPPGLPGRLSFLMNTRLSSN